MRADVDGALVLRKRGHLSLVNRLILCDPKNDYFPAIDAYFHSKRATDPIPLRQPPIDNIDPKGFSKIGYRYLSLESL